jgi:hypothetical protein
MKPFIFLIALLPFQGFGQNTAVTETFMDISGKPFFPTQYQDVQGTPYFFDEFVVSDVQLNNGKVLKNVRTNINLVTDELHYLSEDGHPMIANSAMIKAIETTAPGHYKFVPSPAQNAFFQLLSDGKAQLFKHQKKVMLETKPYNSGTIQKSFARNSSILLAYGSEFNEIKSIDDICQVLSPDGKLKQYASSQKMKKKSQEDWIELVDYFNAAL